MQGDALPYERAKGNQVTNLLDLLSILVLLAISVRHGVEWLYDGAGCIQKRRTKKK